MLLSADHLPGAGIDPEDSDPVSLVQLQASVNAALLPALISEARLAAQTYGKAGYSLLAQTYDLTSALLVHMGKEDLAAIGAERAIAAAQTSDDELLHALEVGNFAWVLLHQGRLEASEKLAALTAERMKISRLDLPRGHDSFAGLAQDRVGMTCLHVHCGRSLSFVRGFDVT